MATINELKPTDEVTIKLVAEARDAFRMGRFAEADNKLSQAEDLEITAAHAAQRLADKAKETESQRLLNAAADRSVRGDIAMVQGSFLAAATHFRQAASLAPANNLGEIGDYQLREANAFYQAGVRAGEPALLENAISAYNKSFEHLVSVLSPIEEWAIGHVRLGRALVKVGRRSLTGTAQFQKAKEAFDIALDEKALPLEWDEMAATYNDVGDLLLLLEQTGVSGQADEAVAYYRAALGFYTEKENPLNWVRAQSSLGYALAMSSQQSGSNELLNSALRALQLALQQVSRELTPVEWIRIESNRAYVLTLLGQYDTGMERTNEAISLLRSVIQEASHRNVAFELART